MALDSVSKIIYMFRHGETDWNSEGRMQGGTDIPLNENGRRQALALAEFFATNPIDGVLSSDLVRAHETAKIAIAQRQVPIILEPRLRETNLGHAEGLTVPEFVAKFGHQILEDWKKIGPEHDHVRIPGGESKQEHRMRFVQGLEEFLHSDAAQKWSTFGVATHGGSMRRLIHHLCPELTEGVMVGNCVAYRLEYQLQTRLWSIDLNPVVRPGGA